MPPPSAFFAPFKIAVFTQYPPKESNRDITLRMMGRKTIHNQDSKIKNILGFCITLMLFIYIFTYTDSTERPLNVMKNIWFLCERWIIPPDYRHVTGVGSLAFKRQLQLPMSHQVSHYHCNTSESSAVSEPKVPANMCAETVWHRIIEHCQWLVCV